MTNNKFFYTSYSVISFNKLLTLSLLCILPFILSSQIQIGDDIDAESALDFFGFSTSMSNDGLVLAVGAPFNDGTASNAGHVRVFQRELNSWVQMGDDLDGANANDNFGRSVDLSEDGTTLIVGADRNDDGEFNGGIIHVYEWDNGQWIEKGSPILGTGSFDLFGKSVAISTDGNTIAAGAPANSDAGNGAGHIRVFVFENGDWVQKGESINGEASFDSFGTNLAMSNDGNKIIMGSPFSEDNEVEQGSVKIYEFVDGAWLKVGISIYGDNAFDHFGSSVAISGDGTTFAAYSEGNTQDGTSHGYTRVFTFQDDTWVLKGETIIGEAEGDGVDPNSTNIALSTQGNIVLIGARSNDGNGEDAGHARIFELENETWTQVADDFDGEAADDFYGHSVSMSGDGVTIAISARNNEGSGSDAGHVRVFGLEAFLTSTENSKPINFSMYPNPTSEFININLEEKVNLQEVIVYNQLGQIVKISKETTLNVSDLNTGVYLIEIKTENASATQKVIIE